MNSESMKQALEHTAAQYRQVSISKSAVEIKELNDCLHMRALEPLEAPPARLLDRLIHWAELRGEQTFIAAREPGGEWRKVSYTQMLDKVRAIARGLLDYNLSADKPLVILSGNDIEHLQIALGAMYAGIPYCPVSPAYALLSKDFAKLRHVCDLLQPGLIFVSDATAFSKAIEAVLPAHVPVVSVLGEVTGRQHIQFEQLLANPGNVEVEEAFAATGVDADAELPHVPTQD